MLGVVTPRPEYVTRGPQACAAHPGAGAAGPPPACGLPGDAGHRRAQMGPQVL